MTARRWFEIPHIHTDEAGKTWLTMGWLWVVLIPLAVIAGLWRLTHR